MSPVLNQRLLYGLCLVIAANAPLAADPPSLLRMFGVRPAQVDTSKPYELTEEDGPWMILASTFAGEGSKQRAERLATEIRNDLKLPAFIYREKFDFTGNLKSNNRVSGRMRYANEYEYDAYAVLVGEYDRIGHPDVESDLKTLKSATPSVFQDPDEVAAETSTATPVTAVKAIKAFIHKRNKSTKGPMVNAFVTRNPMLPEEYFDAPQIDSFVRQLNDDKPFSLLKCNGKYTVVVRTFEGLGTIVDGTKEKKFVESMERLDKCAADAGKMVAELRKKGDEAYQFHDRYRSLVTVGSFETLGRELPDGRFEYAPEIRRVMEKYSAFNAQVARSIPGGNGVAANHIAMIPFDVQPTPIAVPKPTKRSLYGAFGMR